MSALSAISPDFHRFAGLISGTILGQAWREPVDLPRLPAVVLPAPAIIRPSPRAVDETRQLALALSRHRSRLDEWDNTFLGEMLKWRREPSLFEADEIAALAERLFWQARDQASHPDPRGRL